MSKCHRTQIGDYTVGWVYALPIELAATQQILDEKHEGSYRYHNDTNIYTLDHIVGRNVVTACLPYSQMETNSAATDIVQLKSISPSIQFCLMVGIRGGVPSADLRGPGF